MNYGYFRECPIENKLDIVSLFTFFRTRYNSDYVFPGETHSFTEVVCVIDGKAGVTADKNVYMLSAGQMIVHKPDEFHKIWSAGVETEVIIFSFLAKAFPDKLSGVYSLNPENVEEIKQIFEDSGEVFRLGRVSVKGINEGKQTQASIILKKLEIFLLKILCKEHTNEQNYLSVSAKNYISIITEMEKLSAEALTAEELAKHCNMSVPALEKTVKKYAGTGAMEMFMQIKIKKACALLEKGYSVKDAAYSLGFSNQCYFSAVFKKKTGVPPSKWKK